MELLDNIALGLETALSFRALLFCFVGVTIGTFVGVLPGIGALAAISLALPITHGPHDRPEGRRLARAALTDYRSPYDCRRRPAVLEAEPASIADCRSHRR